MAGMMGSGMVPPRGTASSARNPASGARNPPSGVRVAEGPPDTQTVQVEVEEEPERRNQSQSGRNTSQSNRNTTQSDTRSSSRSQEATRRSQDGGQRSRDSQASNSRRSGNNARGRGSNNSRGSTLSAAGYDTGPGLNLSQAWSLPEDEINPRDMRKLKRVLVFCALGTIASFGIGAAGISFVSPVMEAMIAGGFAIIPMMIWSCFCKMLPVLAPRPRPIECRIWARARYKDVEETSNLRFSSMKVIRVKGEKPILKYLGDVQDIHKGLAVLRIGTNCSCCLREWEPEDKLAVVLCGHIFCESCLSEWVVSNKKAGALCPICRFDFTVGSVDPSKIDEEA